MKTKWMHTLYIAIFRNTCFILRQIFCKLKKFLDMEVFIIFFVQPEQRDITILCSVTKLAEIMRLKNIYAQK